MLRDRKMLLSILSSFLLLLQWNAIPTAAFQARTPTTSRRRLARHGHGHGESTLALGAGGNDNNDGGNDTTGATSVAEAERLLAKARAIRESLPETSSAPAAADGASVSESDARRTTTTGRRIPSKFSLASSEEEKEEEDNGFRLYLDIGREPGTWMDPRWGASGRRIECTIDVAFPRPGDEDDATTTVLSASEDVAAELAKTVTSKSSSLSPAYELRTAPCARLRGGFDEMKIVEGGYCVESSASASLSSSSTLRFCIAVDGATDGDVSIPEGKLYFALPYFGLRTRQGEGDAPEMALSNKEGTITVKQMGWHTGWYREESRILGVFRAVPLEKARGRDKF